MTIRRMLCVLLLLVSAAAAQEQSDPVLGVLKQELTRSFQNLKAAQTPPYFLSYELTDNHSIQVSASFGALMSSDDRRTRLLDIDLRVGDYTLDNTHPMSGGRYGQARSMRQVGMPIEDGGDALRNAIWFATDEKYKDAVERLASVKTNVQVKVAAEDKSADFSREKTEKHFEPEAAFSYDRSEWENRVRRYTALFIGKPGIYHATATASGEMETRRYVNSEGSEIRMSMPLYQLSISATAKAEDGMVLPLHLTYMAWEPNGLPDDASIMKDVNTMVEKLVALRTAPLADAYTGPAILSGRASAVFFHEIFGHRVEGQRQKEADDAQTFKKKVNQQVLPPFLSVYSDPTVRRLPTSDLVGFYSYDDEGVKTDRVTIVDKGILRNFLMSRSPIEGFSHSNGHGRRQQGYAVEARQSNLLVESAKKVSRAELKKMLLEQVKAGKKPYGLFFDDIEGGFTFTQRGLPNAFNVLPTLVYRVYPDGHEELVRGVDLIGTPLTAFSKIVATDDETGIFNGMCGADSGWVPVSAVSPGMLVAQIETQRKEKSQEREPILPPPSEDAGGVK